MPLCKRIQYALLFFILLLHCCRSPVQSIDHIYHSSEPLYSHISLLPKPDTLQFNLPENIYNDIKSFNIFQDKGIHYISFYDQRSQSISIYYLMDQRLCRYIPLKKLFNIRQLHKTTVYMRNWDSIFIINKSTLRLFDSSGHRTVKIEFPAKPDNNAALFENHRQPILINHKLFAISRNRVDYKSLNALRNWKVMYAFDLDKETTQLLYPLPKLYQENLYGDAFLEYNFCYNDQGKFVFSFPADTLLYETDLQDYHHSYFARRGEHQDPILPVGREIVDNYEAGRKAYATRDSYGAVFYDPARKYYLRLARHQLRPEDYEAKKRKRQTVLIFNDDFQIIGESDWPEDIDFESVFFTPDGQLYARTNFRNEYALQFVRFAYQNNQEKGPSLAQQPNLPRYRK